MLVSVGLAAATSVGATASAMPAHKAGPPRPVVGKWTLWKAQPDGYEKNVTMTVSSGAKEVKNLAFTPTKSCAGPRIVVTGTLKIKKSNVYYVGDSSSSTVIVDATQGGAPFQVGVIIDFTTARLASVLVSTAVGCDFNLQMRKLKK